MSALRRARRKQKRDMLKRIYPFKSLQEMQQFIIEKRREEGHEIPEGVNFIEYYKELITKTK